VRHSQRKQVRSIFEKEPFGELERLVTQKLLEVAKGVRKENWTVKSGSGCGSTQQAEL